MTLADDNRTLARREIEQYEGRGNLALGPELFTPDYRLQFGDLPPMDHAGHEQLLGGFRGAFPDLEIRVVEQVATRDRVANHWVAHGTHRGAFQNIPATGKPVTITGNNVMHIADGRIRALWGQIDSVGLLAQLGAIPAPPPAYAPWPEPTSAEHDCGPGNADIVRRFADAFNAGRLDRIDAEYDDSYVLDFPGGPTAVGKSGLRQAVTGFRIAFPDLNFATADLFEDSALVAWRWTMTGTHKGDLGPFKATNRPVKLSGISIFRLSNRRIVRDRVRADMAGLLMQIGAVGQTAPA